MNNTLSITLLAAGLLTLAANPVQACSTANWSAAVGGAGLSAGEPGSNHRRFEGECGLRVQAGSTPRYLEDDSPEGEPRYFARFYFFPDDLGLDNGDWVDLFTAYQDERRPSEQLALRLQQTGGERQLVLRARDGAGMTESDPVPVSAGWTGVEIIWKQATGPANGSAELQVEGATRATLSGLDNRTAALDLARLGAVASRSADGTLDFDAFVSHRTTPIGPLLRGDATDDEVIDAADLVAVINELNDESLAQGQPDCNGDGQVDGADLECLARRIVAE